MSNWMSCKCFAHLHACFDEKQHIRLRRLLCSRRTQWQIHRLLPLTEEPFSASRAGAEGVRGPDLEELVRSFWQVECLGEFNTFCAIRRFLGILMIHEGFIIHRL